MTKRKRTTVIALVTVATLLIVAGVAWAAGVFPDVAENDTHFDAIEWAAENGVVNGYANGNFGPYDPILRGQAATMFQNYDEYQKSQGDGTSGCKECHNDTTLIWSKEAQFRERSVHGTGEAFERGEGTNCAGCHGTEGAKARINAGLPPHDPSVVGVVNVSPFDCRTCHDIHTTYTRADFSLTGDEQPVVLEKTGGTFDGGEGNLCANCHQIRNNLPVAAGGNIDLGTDTRFGTHYGVEAQMLLGEGGLGVSGNPSTHYLVVGDTCVTCHMGEERNHTYEPEVDRCQACHAGAEDFDVNGVQTEVQAMLDQVHALLVANGIMNEEGRSIPGVYPEAVASAMWNFKLVEYDGSVGVHNSAFTKALLQQGLDALE
ncbi:MAG: S-layer homology domain-containing protein [Thermoleophilia bacterium]|nr:S-layer homology domain-containing protein [Thermoleophilia bacterium]